MRDGSGLESGPGAHGQISLYRYMKVSPPWWPWRDLAHFVRHPRKSSSTWSERVNEGIASRGASTVTLCPPARLCPVGTSIHVAPSGRYTVRRVAPGSRTGATNRSGPNRYPSARSHVRGVGREPVDQPADDRGSAEVGLSHERPAVTTDGEAGLHRGEGACSAAPCCEVRPPGHRRSGR